MAVCSVRQPGQACFHWKQFHEEGQEVALGGRERQLGLHGPGFSREGRRRPHWLRSGQVGAEEGATSRCLPSKRLRPRSLRPTCTREAPAPRRSPCPLATSTRRSESQHWSPVHSRGRAAVLASPLAAAEPNQDHRGPLAPRTGTGPGGALSPEALSSGPSASPGP